MSTVTIERLFRVSDGPLSPFPIIEFRSVELWEVFQNTKLLLIPYRCGRSFALRMMNLSFPTNQDAGVYYQARVFPWNDYGKFLSPVDGLLDRWFSKLPVRAAEVTHAGRWERGDELRPIHSWQGESLRASDERRKAEALAKISKTRRSKSGVSLARFSHLKKDG